jgi:cell wall-associated NlpC family hydrolase
MARGSNNITVRLTGDSRSLEAALSKSSVATQKFAKHVEQQSVVVEKTKGSFRSLTEHAAALGGAFLGAQGVISALEGGYHAMVSNQKAAAQTAQVLKSTGDVSGVTAAQVSKLADALSKKSGIDRATVQSGENLLLTFRNIRNVAGKNNDIFNQATKAALDLSVAFHRGLGPSSILVGKALNDPIKGLSALQRVGVTFTQGQKDMVKQLVASGNVMGAQKFILEQLTSRVGGAAEAYGKTLPGQIAKLHHTLDELIAQLLQKLLPSLVAITQKLVVWIEKLQKSARFHRDLKQALDIVKNAFDALRSGMEVIWPVLKKVWDSLSHGQKVLLAVGLAFTVLVATNPFLAIAAAAIFAVGEIHKHWGAITKFFSNLWANVERIFQNVWAWIETTAIKTALNVVEPFSHLPGKMGEWARKAKDAMNAELDKIKTDSANRGASAGDAYGRNYYDSLAPWLKAIRKAEANDPYAAKNGAPMDVRAGSAQSKLSPGAVVGGATTGQTRSIVSTAKSTIGVAYQYGGAPSLSKPTDCSGLMVAVFAKNGISLPRTSQAQFASAPIKNAKPLLPGDLVFSEGVHPGHVGLYIGDGMVLEDPHTGSHVQTIPLSSFGWNGESARWWGGKTATGGGGGATAPTAVAPTAADVTQPKAAKVPKVAKPKTVTGAELIPLPLRYALSQAELTRGSADDLKALRAQKTYLERLKANTRSVAKKLSINEELKGVQSSIDSILQSGNTKIQSKLRQREQIAARHAAAMKARMAAAKQAFEDAYSKVAQKALDAFDRATDQGLRDISTKYARMSEQLRAQFGQQTPAEAALAQLQAAHDKATETPSEAALKKLQADHEAAQAAADAASAQTDLQAAIASGDPDAIKQAQQRVDDLRYQMQVAALQKQADAEQAAQDQSYTQQQDALQKQADAERTAQDQALQQQEDALQQQQDAETQGYEDLRANQRDALQAWLDDQEIKLEQGKEQWGDFWTELVKQSGIAGASVSQAFWDGFNGGATSAQNALNSFGDATSAATGGTSAYVPIVHGGGCFTAGTKVAVPGGTRPIETLAEGDEVLVWDFAAGAFVASPVEQVFRHEGDDEREVMAVAAVGFYVAVTTAEHPFWTGTVWVPAGDLAAGDTVFVRSSDGSIRGREVISTAPVAEKRAVYNIHVAHPDHNYVADGFLVHNVKAAVMGTGGIVTRPTFALVGERGPEAVIPLDRMGGSSLPPVNIYVSGSVIAERDLMEAVRRELILLQKRNGTTGIK